MPAPDSALIFNADCSKILASISPDFRPLSIPNNDPVLNTLDTRFESPILLSVKGVAG